MKGLPLILQTLEPLPLNDTDLPWRAFMAAKTALRRFSVILIVVPSCRDIAMFINLLDFPSAPRWVLLRVTPTDPTTEEDVS